MKTRRIERTRLVPHTVDGETEMVLDREIIEVPAPPVDWDQIVRAGVTVLAVVMLIVSVTWSTSSIGSLLSRIVPSAAAYGAACAFDTLWIMCTAVQWLLRTDPVRAKKAEIGGRWALAIAMGAVFADGYLHSELVIGVVGAAVSALAKGGTYLAMLVHARPLDPRTQQWLDKRRAAINGQLGLIPVRRELQRGQAQVDAERRSLGIAEDADQDDTADEIPALPQKTRPGLQGDAGTPVEDLSSLRGMHGPIVYFLGNGNRVKIGTTRDLMSRIGRLCLRFDNLLCAFHGGHDIESRFHKLFAAHRIGDSEWFEIEGELAEFIAQHTDRASGDADDASGDARGDADDAAPDAREVNDVLAPLPPLPAGGSKSSLILAASSMLRPGAPAADIAHLLAQHGHAVDTAYIRTVLSRKKQEDDSVGRGGGGYA